MVISILTLDIFRSIRFAHSHVISRLSNTSLNAFYYTLKTDAYDHSAWNDVTVSKAVQTVPGTLTDQPIFLTIDDTMIEKYGKHFELLLHSKTEKGAAVCSYAQQIQEPFPLTGRTALTKQPVVMERKISFICHWPGMACGGASRFLIMKGKPSGHWRNTGSAARKGSNGW